MLPRLLEQIPTEEPIDTVAANGAHDSPACHAAIVARQASAVMPARRNCRSWKETTPGARARHDTLQSSRLGRDDLEQLERPSQRSLIEVRMRCPKLLGERLMTRTFDRQTAELQIRAALLDRFTALGTPKTARGA